MTAEKLTVEAFHRHGGTKHSYGTIKVAPESMALAVALIIGEYDEGECTIAIGGEERAFPATPEEEAAVEKVFEGEVGFDAVDFEILDDEPADLFEPIPYVEGEYLTREEEAELLADLEAIEKEMSA